MQNLQQLYGIQKEEDFTKNMDEIMLESPHESLHSDSKSPVSSPLESPLGSPSFNDNDDLQLCSICNCKFNQPRVLSCLHIFCTPCLQKLLSGETDDESAAEQTLIPRESITCPTCKQETEVPSRDVNNLMLDFVMCNMIDMSDIEDMQIVCTSCKAKEKAVARCSDCANFLCPNCVTAHQYMRCFENHKVVSFEDIQSSGDAVAIHKPIYCPVHATESLKFFCLSCQTPICNECMVSGHKGHHYERISDVETKQVDELQALVTESKSKIKFCEDASSSLENSLSELQLQRDNAKGLIEETFQSYRVLLEKRRDECLDKLEGLHSKLELDVMEMFHGIEKAIEKIEDGSKFTERVLNNGNSTEILSLKKLMASQLLSLINNTPKPEINVTIEFGTNPAIFKKTVDEGFGHFDKGEPKVVDSGVGLHNSLEVEGFTMPSDVLSPDHAIIHPLPPLSLSGSMTSGSLAGGLHGSIGSAITGGPERSLSRGSQSPAMSDSGISVDASSSGSGVSMPMASLATLMKLGSINVNSQGQVTLNGKALPGLNVNNVTGLPQSLTSHVGHPIRSAASSDTSLNLGILSSGHNSRSQTPSIDTFSNLLGQPSPTGPTFSIPPPSSDLGIPINGSGNGSFSPNSHPPFPVRGSGKMSPMQIRCKFGQLGPGKGQFNSPHGFCLGSDEDIVVADTNNHRIQCFEKSGEYKYQFGIPGREEGQLWYPRKVAVMRNSGKYVVCDRGNERSRMQIFTKNGHFIKKIAIRYIDIVAGLAITIQGHIVAVDSVSPTVFCISETGDLLKWFDCSDYMREPSDIAVSGKEYFVCDFKGHCVVVFNEEGQFMRRIGCENITNFPNGIDISDAGDVLVGDSHGNRFHVAVFQRDGSLIGEFECPYVKVSRCCGLKITSEGYVVTLAKNNHHVLVLNTLYIT